MRKALTAKTIDALKPQVKRYEVHDALCPGFSVRVSPRGQKTFNVKYRHGIRQRRLKLGVYPRLSLSEARERAMAALREVDDGIDPQARRRQVNLRVDAVVDDFISQFARPRNRSWREAERILKREFVSVHGQRDIRQVTRADILEMMDRAIERGATYQANRIHSHLRKLFNWAAFERGKIEASPMVGIKAPTREKARDRVLTPVEVTRLITACRAEPYPFGPYSHPNMNYAVATEGLAVIDCDSKEALRTFRSGYQPPPTFIVKTARGVHFYFRNEMPARNGAQSKLDVKSGPGCYVVGPSSVHASGAIYALWEDEPIADLPGMPTPPRDT